jgi:diguanylate cyclase (GGDEF)-like protein
MAAARQRRQDALAKLAGHSQAVLSFDSTTQDLEQRIAELVNLYQVTKETNRALHLEALVAAFMEIAPRLLGVERMRLLHLEEGPAKAWRAVRESGQVTLTVGALEEAEQAVVRQATADRLNPRAWALPQASWVAAPLWRRQHLAGALIAEGLGAVHQELFAVVAHQLSMQLVRVHLYKRVEALAVTDALTSVWVRRHFNERALDELQRAGRQQRECALLMVDLDRFKEKNDTYGHLVGDVVLRDVAQLIRGHLRDIDLMGRFGGEEFVILLPETDIAQALPIAQRLKQLVEVHPIRAYDELLSQTVSIGLAVYPSQGATLEALVERADQALYAAKHEGRNRVVVWQASLQR